MDKKEIKVIIEKYINEINKLLEIQKVYLFGSYANGTQRPDSDIDIGIFTDKIKEDYFEVIKKLYSIRRLVDVRIEPHLFLSGFDISGFSGEVEKIGIRMF
jgi:predicted nucleotidyltransferase